MERTVYEPEHAAFAASVRAFVERDLLPNLERYRREGAVDRQAWKQAGAVGLLGLAAPGWAGGSADDGSDYRFRSAAIEQLAAASHGLSSTFSIHFDIVTPYVVDLADDAVARTWLPRMVEGSAIAALALTEPGAGSDLAAITTRARRDGEHWVLDGVKTFITNGGIADIAVVAARTSGDDASGISLFLVPTQTPGVSAGPPLDKLGLHESNTAELSLHQVRIPTNHLLGEVDRGFAHLMERLPTERLSSSVANLAQARAALDLAVAYGKERRAFGTPVGSLQHNAFVLADLSARVEATSAFVDACITAKVQGRLSGVDAARAKLLSAQVEHDMLDAAMQLHGGSGYMADSAIGQAWVDGRVTRIWAGSAEVMRLIISRDLGL